MINYRVIGNNPNNEWVVMIHGAGGSTSTWLRQVPDYARHFNLLLVDLAGHGDSQDVFISGKFSFELLADQVMEVVDFFKLEKCHFLALSIGCMVAQMIAQRYPSRVNKLVLAGAITRLNLKAKIIVVATDKLKRILPFKVIKWLLVNIIPKMNHVISDLFRKNCELPTMYLMGVDDYLFIKEAKRAADSNPRSSFVVVPDAGHACNLDNKKFFNKTSIEYFLA